jgi:hypothetical protein
VTWAVGKDKALYVGGTVEDFPQGSAPFITWGAPKIEGRINTTSESEFTFEGGRWGVLRIPFNAISSISYGLEHRHRVPRALLLVIPWDPTEQFTNDAHYLLTLAYLDQSRREHEVVFELGREIARSTLETLERRTGKPVEFGNVEACVRYRTAEECDYGSPAELKGLKKVFLDTGIRSEHRELILAELEKEKLDIEVLGDSDGAEIILRFDGKESQNPECPLCEGGRGEASVRRGTHQRVVFVFSARRTGIGQQKPATKFGRAFVSQFKNANPISSVSR